MDCLADKFDYTHNTKRAAALTCDLLSGNCFDINAALMKLLRLAGIKHVYYIGYFVEDGQLFSRGHCWVSTVTAAGYQSWDIAHHLKRDLGSHGASGPGRFFGSRLEIYISSDIVVAMNPTPHSPSPLPVPEAALMLSALGSLARLSVYRTLLRSGADGATLAQLRERTAIASSTLKHHLGAPVKAGLVEEDRASRQLRCVARLDEIKRLNRFMLRECCTQEHMLGTVAASNRF